MTFSRKVIPNSWERHSRASGMTFLWNVIPLAVGRLINLGMTFSREVMPSFVGVWNKTEPYDLKKISYRTNKTEKTNKNYVKKAAYGMAFFKKVIPPYKNRFL